jgi:hypothetical protein
MRTGFLLIFAVCLFGLGCSRDNTVIINQKVTERVEDFRVKEYAKCREVLLAEAGHIADSLLLEEAFSDVNDSLSRLRPLKPFKPPEVPPIDSAPVRPLFEQGGN